jgi:hypothetical protein
MKRTKNIKFVGYMRADTDIYLRKPKDKKEYVKLLVELK